MRHFCFLSISVGLLFSLLIRPANSYLITQQSADIINSTCKQCAKQYSNIDYDFCVTSLEAIPVSHAVNLPGLAIVAMELALENATSTITTIKEMIDSEAFDLYCLRECLELYEDAVSILEDAIPAFLSEDFDTANIYMSAVMEQTSTCEDCFTEKGEVSSLVKENNNLFEISRIAFCTINLVSMGYPLCPLELISKHDPAISCKLDSHSKVFRTLQFAPGVKHRDYYYYHSQKQKLYS